MTTLVFKIHIRASAEKLWHSLWQSDSYTQWTSAFCAGSYYKTDYFGQGSKIHLLSPGGNGMYSLLEEVQENRFLAFRHLGEIVNFEEQIVNEDQGWSNAIESYEIIPHDGFVELVVKVDTLEQYVDYMNESFPTALEVLKSMAEKLTII